MQTVGDQAPSTEGLTDEIALDDVLAAAVDLARATLTEDVPADQVGEHLGVSVESTGSGHAITHRFVATQPGYVGWYWAVCLARADDEQQITVNEVVLLPGDGAIEGQPWVPWAKRLRREDLHPGDLVPTDPADERLVPGYTLSDDPQVESVAWELGLGRERVLSRQGRLDAAARWSNGSYGGSAAMARHAPAACGTCGFYLPLAGSMQGMFGACANEISPADGQVVTAEYGCGAHSNATAEIEVELATRGMTVYDTFAIEIATRPRGAVLSAQQRDVAAATLAAVLADAAARVSERQSLSVTALTPAQVLQAVRTAFGARQQPASPRLTRTKK